MILIHVALGLGTAIITTAYLLNHVDNKRNYEADEVDKMFAVFIGICAGAFYPLTIGAALIYFSALKTKKKMFETQ